MNVQEAIAGLKTRPIDVLDGKRHTVKTTGKAKIAVRYVSTADNIWDRYIELGIGFNSAT